MDKIQYISLGNEKYDGMACTAISAPNAFDSYDINIINLGTEYIWRNSSNSMKSINCCEDLCNIKDMLENSKNKKVLIILPQNIKFYYNYYRQMYNDYIEIKNYLDGIISILINNLNIPYFALGYENNKTEIKKEKGLKSSFYFRQFTGNTITSAIDSNKPTTININDYYFTTLAIENKIDLLDFLNNTKLIKMQEDIPEWLDDYDFLNDKDLKIKKIEKEKEIVALKNELKSMEKGINENIYFKRILIESGDSLVEIVYKILDEIFSINLFDFVDKKAEDFIFKYKETTFIGEIKGISTNVKKANISQLDDHYCNFIDDKNDEEIQSIKPLLIINHQRLVELNKRQPVSDDVIIKAKNNNALIIESKTLLKIYEMFKKEVLTTDEIHKMFLQVGLLKL